MNLLFHFIKNFDQCHWAIQWFTYGLLIGVMVAVLIAGKGKYF